MFLLRYTFVLMLTGWLVGCSQINSEKTQPEKVQLAKVNNNILYISDIQDIVPIHSSFKDSAEIVDRYVNNWVRKQLLFSQAQEQLPLDNPDIERKVADYRYSLYIFELKKKLIDARLDSSVSEKELLEYYTKEISDFLLQETIMKGIWIKLPVHSKAERALRNQLSVQPFTIETISKLCVENQFTLKKSIDQWQDADNFLARTPLYSSTIIAGWKNGLPYLTARNKEFLYLLKITDLKQPIEPAPIDYVADKIKAIVLNKRKLAIANELEDQLFNEAIKKNKVEISYKPFSATEK